MRSFLIYLISTVFIFTSLKSQADQFTLGADDIISVIVFNEIDLSHESVRISTTGDIPMPLIGQVEIAGLSIAEAESKIKFLYSQGFLKNPDISISVIEYRLFYIDGMVENPGGYNYRKGMTVQRAITLAGGFTERADKEEITIKNNGEKTVVADGNLDHSISPGDVIVVKERFF